MITDAQAEAAGQWIYDSCEKIAEAKSNRVYIEERLRVIRSEIMLATEGTVAFKEATAFASSEYAHELEAYRNAVREETFLNAKMKAAEMKIELWRTGSANARNLR
jgi:hypothetical protein